MESLKRDYFLEKANEYDNKKSRKQNVDNIAKSILKELSLSKEMNIMDFGSGTGLLLSNIAPYVNKVTAIDISTSMNEVLKSKRSTICCNLQILEIDITKKTIGEKFDSIISSMTIHHIEDVLSLFKIFYSLLNKSGSIALADLDKEDGSFHTTDTGVFHQGFDRNEFLTMAGIAGFKDLKIQTVSEVNRPTGHYPIFLLTGKR